eukprot:scaffold118539_cov31-Tisochrysis_lutea.AAC.2
MAGVIAECVRIGASRGDRSLVWKSHPPSPYPEDPVLTNVFHPLGCPGSSVCPEVPNAMKKKPNENSASWKRYASSCDLPASVNTVRLLGSNEQRAAPRSAARK